MFKYSSPLPPGVLQYYLYLSSTSSGVFILHRWVTHHEYCFRERGVLPPVDLSSDERTKEGEKNSSVPEQDSAVAACCCSSS